MTARYFFFAVLFLLLECSLGVVDALAAKRPGAARPLRLESGAWMIGTEPHASEGKLFFSSEGNGVRAFHQAVLVEDDNHRTTWQMRPLASTPGDLSFSLAPDGRHQAFASNRSGLEAIYVIEIKRGPEPLPRRVATLARNPCWLDASTLLFDSTRPGHAGLYKITVPRDENTSPGAARMVFEKGGEAAVAPDGQTICVASRDERLGDTQLYLLASDGSGARTIPQTAGARHPNFAVDGSAIFFDAPAPREESDKSTQPLPRVIWMVPLVSSPPAAQITGVRKGTNGEIEIIGTAFSESAGANVRLELGEGEEPAHWKEIAPRATPIHDGVLASWRPGAMPDGSTWTLRLTVSDAARAQSTLTFNWPLDTDPGAAPFIPLFATDRERYGLGPLPDEPAAETPVPVVAVPDKAAPVPVTGTIALPQPAVVSTPRVTPAPGPAVETKQKPPLPAPAVRVEARPVPKPTPAPTPKPKPKPVPQPRPTPAPKSAPKPQPQKNTGGIPSQMQINSSVPVTVVLRNTGTRSWSSQGASPVRLVYRWVDAKTGIRYRWALQWLREVVPPGGSTRLKFDLDAPPRAGNYILTYALVRLNWPTYDGKKYVPPASQAKDHRWPGEFGAVSFRITVAS